MQIKTEQKSFFLYMLIIPSYVLQENAVNPGPEFLVL